MSDDNTMVKTMSDEDTMGTWIVAAVGLVVILIVIALEILLLIALEV